MATNADTNEDFECFVWTRTEATGLMRAESDAKKFGVKLSRVWAIEIKEI